MNRTNAQWNAVALWSWGGYKALLSGRGAQIRYQRRDVCYLQGPRHGAMYVLVLASTADQRLIAGAECQVNAGAETEGTRAPPGFRLMCRMYDRLGGVQREW